MMAGDITALEAIVRPHDRGAAGVFSDFLRRRGDVV